MKDYMKIPTKVYSGIEMDKYFEKKYRNNDQDDGDSWKDSLPDDTEAPQGFIGYSLIKPEKILSVHEIFSVEAIHENPENPQFDVLQIVMDNGEDYLCPLSLKEFEERMVKYYSNLTSPTKG